MDDREHVRLRHPMLQPEARLLLVRRRRRREGTTTRRIFSRWWSVEQLKGKALNGPFARLREEPRGAEVAVNILRCVISVGIIVGGAIIIATSFVVGCKGIGEVDVLTRTRRR